MDKTVTTHHHMKAYSEHIFNSKLYYFLLLPLGSAISYSMRVSSYSGCYWPSPQKRKWL